MSIFFSASLSCPPQASVASDSPLLSTAHCQASFALAQQEARHILINYKGDTAGRSDTDQVGGNAFVETHSTFVPGEKLEKLLPHCDNP